MSVLASVIKMTANLPISQASGRLTRNYKISAWGLVAYAIL